MPADSAIPPVQPAPTSITAFVGSTGQGPVDKPVTVTSLASYLATFGPRNDTARSLLDHSIDLFFANGGTEAVVVRAAGPSSEWVVPARRHGGLGALTERFTVLVLPDLTARDHRAVERALARCAEERAVLLLDLPVDADLREAALYADQVPGPRDRAAAYHPWLVLGARSYSRTGAPLGGVAVPPSGAVAGLMARIDAEYGVWQSPAGPEGQLRGIDGLDLSLSPDDADLLHRHGVNTLHIDPVVGRAVWGGHLLAASGGGRTVEPSSRYLSVRRLTDHVLTSLEEGMSFVRDRRADPGLLDLVRRRADFFLAELWQRQALTGSRPQEGYFVRCDATTTTQADLDAGRIVLLVGLATLRPSEFEIHRILLETSRARAPQVLPEPVAVARAGELARNNNGVMRRVDLRPIVSGYAQETEERLSRVFENAAHSSTVLLLEGADAVFGRRTEGAGPDHRRATELGRLLDQLSHHNRVPFVLAGRRSAQ